MGQSVTRVNDRESVPGPLGHGMGERPMIGVGRERGHEEIASPETAAVPPVRRKHTLGEQHVKEEKQDEEQKGFRGRLRRGWLTTIGVFHRKHDVTTGPDGKKLAVPVEVESDTIVRTSTPSIPIEPKSAPISSSQSSAIPPATPPSSGGGRMKSSPAMTAASVPSSGNVMSPVMRGRSGSMAARSTIDDDNDDDDGMEKMTPNEVAATRAAMLKSGKPQQGHDPNWQSSTPIAAGMSSSGIQSGSPLSTSPRTRQNMTTWWRTHRPSLEQVMPPQYAPANIQPDELHREARDPTYQSSNPMSNEREPNSPSISKGGMVGSFDEAIPPTTMKPHSPRGGGRKRSASPSPTHGNLDDQRKAAMAQKSKPVHDNNDDGNAIGLPPMYSTWNTQPDELHREPAIARRWRNPSSSGAIGGGTGSDGGGPTSEQAKHREHHESHQHYWPPGQKSLHDNDHHSDPGGWPMNP